ncbi:MAG TPA: chromate transporter, partial [Polyangiaceae bacterium]|nr:chromate transporter [Polyangiaceae bacterium]
MARAGELEHTLPGRRRALRVIFICLTLWFVPIGVLTGFGGSKSLLLAEAWLFSKLAVVTFGGAYAVLAYVAQQAVQAHAWLSAGEMLDGLGLAETTPGPLILVLEFVGFMAAFRHPAGHNPWVFALAGAAITVWVTFVPCFLWIFLGAPYVEALRRSRALGAALSAITAAVVGVILNLSVWFGLHVLFARVEDRRFGPLALQVPVLSSLDPLALGLCAAAVYLLFRSKLGLPLTLAFSAVVGGALKF